jgi:hypothetical protein
MEGLPFVRLVDSHIRIVAGQPHVFHMTKNMAFRILRTCTAEVAANAKKGDCRFPQAPALHRQAAQQRKTATIQHLISQPGQARRQPGQRKIRRRQPCDGGIGPGGKPVHGRLHLCDLGCCELPEPVLLTQHGRAIPGGNIVDFGRQFGEIDVHGGADIAKGKAPGQRPGASIQRSEAISVPGKRYQSPDRPD